MRIESRVNRKANSSIDCKDADFKVHKFAGLHSSSQAFMFVRHFAILWHSNYADQALISKWKIHAFLAFLKFNLVKWLPTCSWLLTLLPCIIMNLSRPKQSCCGVHELEAFEWSLRTFCCLARDSNAAEQGTIQGDISVHFQSLSWTYVFQYFHEDQLAQHFNKAAVLIVLSTHLTVLTASTRSVDECIVLSDISTEHKPGMEILITAARPRWDLQSQFSFSIRLETWYPICRSFHLLQQIQIQGKIMPDMHCGTCEGIAIALQALWRCDALKMMHAVISYKCQWVGTVALT